MRGRQCGARFPHAPEKSPALSSSVPTSFASNLRGILAIVASNLCFLTNDTLVKLASSEMPLGQIIFIRGLFAIALLMPLVIYTGAYRAVPLLFSRHPWMRTLAEVMSAALYLTALVHIPIANASIILQIVPLALTAVGALFLGEQVGWRRWTAIIIGFMGVLIVIRPGVAGFHAYSLLALAAVGFIVLRDVCSRLMSRSLPAILIAQVTSTAMCLAGPAISLVTNETWVVPQPRELILIGFAVVFIIGGYLTAIDYMRHGDIATVVPFRYSLIIWAILAGYLVWGDVPDAPMLIGAGIIIATGIYIVRRESRRPAARRD